MIRKLLLIFCILATISAQIFDYYDESDYEQELKDQEARVKSAVNSARNEMQKTRIKIIQEAEQVRSKTKRLIRETTMQLEMNFDLNDYECTAEFEKTLKNLERNFDRQVDICIETNANNATAIQLKLNRTIEQIQDDMDSFILSMIDCESIPGCAVNGYIIKQIQANAGVPSKIFAILKEGLKTLREVKQRFVLCEEKNIRAIKRILKNIESDWRDCLDKQYYTEVRKFIDSPQGTNRYPESRLNSAII